MRKWSHQTFTYLTYSWGTSNVPGILVGKGDKKVKKIWSLCQGVFIVDICRKSVMYDSTWGEPQKNLRGEQLNQTFSSVVGKWVHIWGHQLNCRSSAAIEAWKILGTLLSILPGAFLPERTG